MRKFEKEKGNIERIYYPPRFPDVPLLNFPKTPDKNIDDG